jgi:TatD DNase family protein
MLIDTHCHLDFERFDDDRDAVVARAQEAGVGRIIVPALDLDNAEIVLKLAEKYAGVFAAVGVHPNSAANWQDSWLRALRELAAHPKVVAIGEIGLDYYRDHCPPAIQRRALQRQLELAADLNLPVILHNREADHDMLELLAASPISKRSAPGVLHSFSSDWDMAQQALDKGFYIGFTGPLTYPKSDSLREVAARVTLERLLVETDAPFLAPQPRRGRRNEPAYVTFVAEGLEALRGLETSEITRITTENAVRLFGPQIGPASA